MILEARKKKMTRLSLLACVCLSLPLPTASFLSRQVGVPLRFESALKINSNEERDLEVMSLLELKAVAESLGISEPDGHKGRKATWIDAILKSPDGPPTQISVPASEVLLPVSSPLTSNQAGAFGPSEDDAMREFLQARPNNIGLLASICQAEAPAEKYLKEIVAAGGASMTANAALGNEEKYAESDEDRKLLERTMEFLQNLLLGFGDVEEDPEEDPDFIAEGRRILALERFPVRNSASETYLVEALWSEIAGLMSAGPNKGSLLLFPKFSGGDIRTVLNSEIRPVLTWLGLGEDVLVKGYRMSQGSPCPLVRVLYQVETDMIEYEESEAPGPIDLSDELRNAVKSDADSYVPIGGDVAEAMKNAETEINTSEEKPGDLTDLLLKKVNPRWLNRK